MTAYASAPTASRRSSTASFVIDDVDYLPPATSIRTCAVVAPYFTSMTRPLSTFRALSLMWVSLALCPVSAAR